LPEGVTKSATEERKRKPGEQMINAVAKTGLSAVDNFGLGERPPPARLEHHSRLEGLEELNAALHQASHGSVGEFFTAYGQSAPGMQTEDAGRADPAQEGQAPAAAADTPWAELRHNVHTVAVWWAIWSLYDHLLSPFSPVAETTILCLSVAYCMRGELLQRLRPRSAGTNATQDKAAAETETISA
jgi:hypothetical protein